MEKARVLMSGFVLVLLLLLAVSVQPEISGSLTLRAEKLFCSSGPGWSDNPPYSELYHEYRWWINVTIISRIDCWNVEISDQFGPELKVEGITIGNPEGEVPMYTLVCGDYRPGGPVAASKDGATSYAAGFLDEEGIRFDGWRIYWTGESLEAHVKWKVGSLRAGETLKFYFVVSTDTNLSGEQEFTSYGTYNLDSGVTIKGIGKIWWIINGPIDSKVDGIRIEVTGE